MSAPVLEAKLVDLTDDELKEYLGHVYEAIKTLEEKKSSDPELKQMKDRVKLYENDNYNEEIKKYKANLKAARSQAKVRKISFKLPGDK